MKTTLKKAYPIMLPIEKVTQEGDLCKLKSGTLAIAQNIHIVTEGSKNSIPQYLYLVSDDEIKEGDWFVNTTVYTLHQCSYADKNIQSGLNHSEYHGKFECKKIIATTDKLLVNPKMMDTYLPQIPESFIKQFVEANGKIDEVMVDCETSRMSTSSNPYQSDENYKIITELKTTSNNEVIIHLIDNKKMYSREDVADKIRQFFNYNEDMVDEDDCDKWIEKNLTK